MISVESESNYEISNPEFSYAHFICSQYDTSTKIDYSLIYFLTRENTSYSAMLNAAESIPPPELINGISEIR